MDVSVVIVNYNVKHFTEQCLRSVIDAAEGMEVEVFVVDNASSDGSLEYLQPRFPGVRFIPNRQNVGFARANNQALAQATGRYLLILNPDTLLSRDTLKALVNYLEANPRVGAAGPKILTREGKYDPSSKRGLPTPWVAFCRLSGLSYLFPRSRTFNRYQMLWLDENKPAKVEALTGSCMMVRREAYLQTGGFDGDYFMFGEDLDWSYRIAQAGWEIHYAPVTQVIHFRGESTRRGGIDRERAFYGAMHMFVDKHFRGRYPTLAHWLITVGIGLAEAAARSKRLWKKLRLPLADAAALAVSLVVARVVRWGHMGLDYPVLVVLALQVGVWVASLSAFGVYGAGRGATVPVLWGMGLGFLVNSTFTYFFKQFAYSRFVNLFGLVGGTALVLGWRWGLQSLRTSSRGSRLFQRRTLIVGCGPTGRRILERLQSQKPAHYLPIGWVDPEESKVGFIVDGLPVLGTEGDLARLALQEEIEEVVFAYESPDYDRVLQWVERVGRTARVSFRVIHPDSARDEGVLTPLLSVEYLVPRRLSRKVRSIKALVTGK